MSHRKKRGNKSSKILQARQRRPNLPRKKSEEQPNRANGGAAIATGEEKKNPSHHEQIERAPPGENASEPTPRTDEPTAERHRLGGAYPEGSGRQARWRGDSWRSRRRCSGEAPVSKSNGRQQAKAGAWAPQKQSVRCGAAQRGEVAAEWLRFVPLPSSTELWVGKGKQRRGVIYKHR